MSNDRLKLGLINQLNIIAGRLDDSFEGMTVGQVKKLEEAIEAVWGVVCRRRK